MEWGFLANYDTRPFRKSNPLEMLRINRQRALPVGSVWLTLPPLRLGKVPPGAGTTDLFITIEDDRGPVLRVDLYADQAPFVREEAIVWGERGFVGFGNSVYVIDPKAQAGSTIRLDSYFAGFYWAQEYLLAATGCSLMRLSPVGDVLWKAPDLGLDGVYVKKVDRGLVRGEGEWDPPGGLKPFVLRLESGKRIHD